MNILRLSLVALVAVHCGGCYIETFSDPIPIPASYAPQQPQQTYPPPVTTRPVATGAQATTAPVQPPAAVAPVIDERAREQIGQVALGGVTRRFGVDASPQLNEYLILVGSLVTINTPRPDVEYKYVLLDTDQPVSCAVWPRTICVSRGLIKQMEDESELAGVIAREISNLISGRGLKAAGVPVPAEGSATRPTTQPTTVPATAAQTALVNRTAAKLVDVLVKDGMGAELEGAADLEGAQFAAAAKYAPDGFLRLLTRQKPAAVANASSGAEWERIKALDVNVGIVAKAYPHSDAKLPARFEGYVRPAKGEGTAEGR